MNFPTWVTAGNADPKTIRKNKIKFLIRQAANHFSESGHVSVLATACGHSRQAINLAFINGYMTAGLACAIESAVGKDVAPKHLLCPEKFSE